MRILIVDDDESLLAEYQIAISELGYCCESVTNGLQAFEKLSQTKYDIVLCDYQMPGWDGLKLLKMAHMKQPMLPFFMVCQPVTADIRAQLMEQPNLCELRTKPIKLLTLLEVLGEFLARNKRKTELLKAS